MNALDVVSTVEPPAVWVVRVVGDLDLASAPALRNRINQAANDPTRDVVVDLSGVSFMDCAGLHTLLTAQGQLGDRLSLRWPSAAVLWLIGLAGLHDVFGTQELLVGSQDGATVLPSRPLPL